MARLRIKKPEGFESFRTVAELAEYLGVSARSVERWHQRGRVKPDHVTEEGWKLYSKETAFQLLSEIIQKGRIN